MGSTKARIVLALIGSLFVGGCAAEASPTRDETPVDPSTDTSAKQSDPTSSTSENNDTELPVTPVTPIQVTGEDTGTKTDPTTPPTTDPPATTPPGTTPPAPKTASKKCTASNSGGQSSVSTIDYTITNGRLTINKLTVNVANKDSGRNANDVDVYVTPQGGKESKILNSGDILKAGQTVEVKLPSSFPSTPGMTVRILTNFDEFGPDSTASCPISLN